MRRTLLVLGLLAVTLAGPAVAAPAAEKPDAQPQKDTIVALRAIGTALYSWAVDTAGERTVEPEADNPGAEVATVRWSGCPAASYEEVQRLLVPQHLSEVPRTDGWGHALEFCVDPKGVSKHGQRVIGVRSSGSDGRFEGDAYTVGAFDPAQDQRDVVWMDGYFLTWPQKK